MVVPGQQAPTWPCTQHNSALVVYITCMNCLLAVLATGSLETWRFTYMEMVKTSERRQLRDLGCERGKKPKQLVSGLTMKRNKPGRDCLILCHGHNTFNKLPVFQGKHFLKSGHIWFSLLTHSPKRFFAMSWLRTEERSEVFFFFDSIHEKEWNASSHQALLWLIVIK